MKFNSKHFFIKFFLLCFMVMTSCSNSKDFLGNLIVKEILGVDRDIEYITIDISFDKLKKNSDLIVCLKENNSKNLIKGQLLSERKNNGLCIKKYLFPVAILGNESKNYKVVLAKEAMSEGESDIHIKGEGLDVMVENKYYEANLRSLNATKNNGLNNGQLAGLKLKKFESQVLQREDINMHWAPNFQKEGYKYKTMGHIQEFDSISINSGLYLHSVYRSGKVTDYEEIDLEATYKFYAGLPYFIFYSKMEMLEDVELIMLRNDEMTMDSFFTHAMFSLPDGTAKEIDLYDNNAIKKLKNAPIERDAEWLFFYNKKLKYALGSIRLKSDIKNLNGVDSPTYESHTRITKSEKEGRYWDRRFIDNGSLKIPKGSKYLEENAYLVFKADSINPSKEIEKYNKIIKNPVQVFFNQY